MVPVRHAPRAVGAAPRRERFFELYCETWRRSILNLSGHKSWRDWARQVKRARPADPHAHAAQNAADDASGRVPPRARAGRRISSWPARAGTPARSRPRRSYRSDRSASSSGFWNNMANGMPTQLYQNIAHVASMLEVPDAVSHPLEIGRLHAERRALLQLQLVVRQDRDQIRTVRSAGRARPSRRHPSIVPRGRERKTRTRRPL